ncbi:hypothetical protein KKD81_02885 [Patescibacteria group bacterium]|nr:hypothetical protein [Patescibacteria group bacterium]MBU2159105.1 hypothetical protein [Patescibacteria group bacterium]MBU2220856.1 hypothetical protein [Patescibacteria group bacterium]
MKTKGIFAGAILLYSGIFLALHGVRFVDFEVLPQFHLDPFAALPTSSQALHGSPLPAIIGNVLGIVSENTIQIFYVLLVLAAFGALMWYVRHIGKEKNSPLFFLLIALTPLPLVLISWIGKPDPLVVLAYIGFLVSSAPVLIAGSAFLLLLAHKEVAILLLLIHAILFPSELRKISIASIGVVMGLIYFALYTNIVGTVTDRTAFVAEHLSQLLQTPLIAALFIFNWFLLVLLLLYKRGILRSVRILAAIAVIFVVSVFVVLDHTRIAALLSLPLYVYVLRKVADAKEGFSLSKKQFLILLVVSLLQIEAVTTGLLVNTVVAHYVVLYEWLHLPF